MAANEGGTERMRGAVWGMFVADAYCLGSHGIDDEATFAARFPEGPEGFDEPNEDHFHAGKPQGALTHYGEGALLLLQSLAAVGGFDAERYGEMLYGFYGRHGCVSHLDEPTRHLVERRRREPAEIAYGEHAALVDDRNVTTSRLTPLVARYAGSPALMLHVDRATRVLQSHDLAVAYACAQAKLLEDLLAGLTLDEAVARLARLGDARTPLGAELRQMVEAVGTARRLDVDAATGQFGRACGLLGTFPASLHTALHHSGDFEAAIHACARARGDSASRAMLIGAWLGASLGLAAVPEAWRARLVDRAAIGAGLQAVLAARDERAPLGAVH